MHTYFFFFGGDTTPVRRVVTQFGIYSCHEYTALAGFAATSKENAHHEILRVKPKVQYLGTGTNSLRETEMQLLVFPLPAQPPLMLTQNYL